MAFVWPPHCAGELILYGLVEDIVRVSRRSVQASVTESGAQRIVACQPHERRRQRLSVVGFEQKAVVPIA